MTLTCRACPALHGLRFAAGPHLAPQLVGIDPLLHYFALQLEIGHHVLCLLYRDEDDEEEANLGPLEAGAGAQVCRNPVSV